MVDSLLTWRHFAVARNGIYYISDTRPRELRFARFSSPRSPLAIPTLDADSMHSFEISPEGTELLISTRQTEGLDLRVLDLLP